MRAAVEGASASRAVTRALAASGSAAFPLSTPLHVIAAGKAASGMATAFARQAHCQIKTVLAVGTHRDAAMPEAVEWHEAAHPLPDARSEAGARRALDVARHVERDETLVLLLSGGASAVMALPLDDLALADKRATIRTMMGSGADIHALNTVRKHLSAIKGGRLAAACRGATLTLAVSDVVGDDLAVIGSGPGVPDASTWSDASRALERYGGNEHVPAVRDLIARGLRGSAPDTPKPGDSRVARARGFVIASRRHALDGARDAALERGFTVAILPDDVTGEARDAASVWWRQAAGRFGGREPLCLLSAGETTVRVTGAGRGGRNQEFVLALMDAVAGSGRNVIVASVGTDGIDGPTDAAGALVDPTSRERAAALGLDPEAFLQDNNAYDVFAQLGDLIHLGRTDTNVGDVQVLLAS